MLRLAAAPALLMLLAVPAAAQTRHDTAAPIDFGADHIELQDRANRAVLSGNVKVRQAEMTLTAQRMTVAYTGQVIEGNPQVSRLDASGGVTVVRPDQTARSQFGVYDLNRRVITMLGSVKLMQGGNTVNGGRLTINLDSGRAVIDGSSVAGGAAAGTGGVTQAPNGRVTGTFSVPKRN
ncbi:LptA/OstA family protein [Sphingomonas sp. 8AM]|uniref:LptA/OstA family protein n=1 Tax=Sphingomonas sp. 8AM TaxID=2653170 RepID=UPI0012F256FF|nr:LptA/OstA family protein [Sphingomonas sp. 8AM]VXC94932.1 OstA family protein [Sphingomonas sp. 8AM]